MRLAWKTVGAIAASLFVAGLFVEVIWAEPAGGEPLQAGELEWDWATRSQTPKNGCTEFEHCFFLRVKDTASCPENIMIELMFTDKNDWFLSDSDVVIESPKSAKGVVIELGTDDKNAVYDYVGPITCSSSPLSEMQGF